MSDGPDLKAAEEEAPALGGELDERVVHPDLPSAVHAVMCDVGYVQKGNQADYGDKFTYASDGDLIRGLRPSMLRHGLVLLPVDAEHSTQDVPTARGGIQYMDKVLMTYHLKHVDSGETQTIRMPGNGMDSRDKGVYKGLTGAYKYALREIFMIETGDDPEGPDSAAQGALAEEAEALREEVQNLKQTMTDSVVDAETRGREWVICNYLMKQDDDLPEDERFDGRTFAGILKKRKLPRLEDVRFFCLWMGRPKPSQLDVEARERLLNWLGTRPGQARFERFVEAVGL